ncbi:hypothetical protein PIB30_086679 [Stylosanthes scabra]|uniref:Uncharacterized protein n=1 Tax=Stylosanthes scabra TaxID=79078 RepID=A0ABU6UVW9_9FABA|nr:hypothetical protein [Stylosanthes scabra]
MLKEIKEGQQVTATLEATARRHLQEDNTVTSTHNFYDATTNPPYNRQYYTQGGHDNQPARWIPPQQQQAQLRQPYTYSQPQNSQNPRYQPQHNCRQYSPSNNPPFNFDEGIRIVQKENQEMREAQKRTEAQLSHLTQLLQKISNQSTVSPQAQAQPSSPLLSQPLLNPKGGINAVQVEEEEDKIEDENDKNDCLYELLKKLANFDDEESEDESEEEDKDESTEEGSEDEFVEEGDQTEEEAREEDRDKGKISFINTLFKEKRNKEEVPIKCGDPSPCLVTCKI